MEVVQTIIDFIIHIDDHLIAIVHDYKTWTYLILFLIIFAETGLVVTPFLPGDSLLFATGAIIANPESGLSIFLMTIILIIAAILGDLVNYHIGKYIGPRAFSGRVRFLKKEYLLKTQEFYTSSMVAKPLFMLVSFQLSAHLLPLLPALVPCPIKNSHHLM